MSPTLDDWFAAGRWFAHRGQQIFYRDEGSGPPLLCLHGFPTASWDWHRIWPALTARYRVIAPDMIGFGFSAKPAGYPYSILDQADLHEALCQQLGLTAVDVLAHDYGDTVAQELLARQQERRARGEVGLRLNRVCFLNGGLLPEAHQPRLIQRLLLTPIGPVLGRLLSRRRFGGSLGAVFGPQTQPTTAEMDDFWRLVTHNQGKRIAHRLLRYMPERKQYRDRWVGALVAAAVPLRLIDGPADPVSGRHLAAAYADIVPDADVVLLADHIGHYPQVEDPEGMLAAFWEFMGEMNDHEIG